MVTLQAITPAVAEQFKAARLSALLDTPTAFGSTHAKEVQLSDSDWKKRTVLWSSERSVGYLAFADENPCGIAGSFLDESDPTTAHLISMWVAPASRECGVGMQLVEAVGQWARSKGAKNLCLMVTSSNQTALGFYKNLGFVRTGRTEPYPNDPSLIEYEMKRAI